MQLKGTIVGLAAIALVLSVLPTAAAGIPVPKGAVEALAADAAATGGAVAEAFADDQTALGMTVELAVSRTADSVGDALLEEGDGEVYVATGEVLAAGGIALDSASDGGTAGFGFAAKSAETLSPALQGVGFGTYEAAQGGLDAASAFGVQTEDTVEQQVLLFGATTQSTARQLGAVQGVVTQGALATYNAHAAPAACVVAGVAANLAGTVSGQESCSLLLQS